MGSKLGELSSSFVLRAFCSRTQFMDRSDVTSSSQRYGSSAGSRVTVATAAPGGTVLAPLAEVSDTRRQAAAISDGCNECRRKRDKGARSTSQYMFMNQL